MSMIERTLVPFLGAAILLAPPAAGQGLFREHIGQPGDQRGAGLASAGDVNHDGIDDYAIGSPYEMVAGSTNGVVRVHSGATGTTLWTFAGTAPIQFGWSLDGGGDIDQDGYPDLIVGSDGTNVATPDAGMIQIFSGSTGLELLNVSGEKTNNQFSHDLAYVGDLNLDGHVDFAVGAPRLLSETGVYPSGIPGKVVAFSGKDGTPLHTWIGGVASDAFGVAVAAAGDTNGDGRDDVAVGAWGPSSGPGNAYVYSGADGALLHHITGSYAGQNLGLAMDGVGDVDGDGRADFAVGVPGWDAVLVGFPVAGEVIVYSGATGTELITLHGGAPRDLFGCQIAALGDADGDGSPDLAVCSSPYDPQSFTYSNGSIGVYRLKDGSAIHSYAVAGSSSADITTKVGAAGDVNGDGLQDLLLGARVANVTGAASGKAQVLWIGNTGCGSFTSIGTPCAGTSSNTPQLSMTGCPTAGGYVQLNVSGGPPFGLAYVAIGFGETHQPVGGGCSWYIANPLPSLLGPFPLGGFGPGQGSYSLQAMIPPGVGGGTIVHQAIVVDVGAPLGFTTTNAVRETIQ